MLLIALSWPRSGSVHTGNKVISLTSTAGKKWISFWTHELWNGKNKTETLLRH